MHLRAFTLIEIIISIAIIAVIASIVLSGYQNFASKTALRSVGQDIIASARLAQTQATGAKREGEGAEGELLQPGSYTLKIPIKDKKLQGYSVYFSTQTEDLYTKEKTEQMKNPKETVFFATPSFYFNIDNPIDVFADICFINESPPIDEPRCRYALERESGGITERVDNGGITNSITTATAPNVELNIIFRPDGLDVDSYIVILNGESFDFNAQLSQSLGEGDWGVRLVLQSRSNSVASNEVVLDFLRTGEVSLR